MIDSLLAAGNAKIERDLTIEGRKAVRITGADAKWNGTVVYTVDAVTYDPIEFQLLGGQEGGKETGATTTMRFLAYEKLPVTDANMALLDLTAQHPGATVDRDPQDFAAAEVRMFDKGQDPAAGKAVAADEPAGKAPAAGEALPDKTVPAKQ